MTTRQPHTSDIHEQVSIIKHYIDLYKHVILEYLLYSMLLKVKRLALQCS